MDSFHPIVNLRFEELNPSEKNIINEIWEHKTEFIQWPAKALLLWEGCIRIKYHEYPEEIKNELKSGKIAIDSRSNGPAIMSFLLAGGKRPHRASNPNQQWHIHHIYDGKFPWKEKEKTLHAVEDGKHFTQSAGLVAIHPVAEALSDEYFYFAWLLRYESLLRFDYDPDMVFCSKTDEHGFKVS
jgi:hypothetical protein